MPQRKIRFDNAISLEFQLDNFSVAETELLMRMIFAAIHCEELNWEVSIPLLQLADYLGTPESMWVWMMRRSKWQAGWPPSPECVTALNTLSEEAQRQWIDLSGGRFTAVLQWLREAGAGINLRRPEVGHTLADALWCALIYHYTGVNNSAHNYGLDQTARAIRALREPATTAEERELLRETSVTWDRWDGMLVCVPWEELQPAVALETLVRCVRRVTSGYSRDRVLGALIEHGAVTPDEIPLLISSIDV